MVGRANMDKWGTYRLRYRRSPCLFRDPVRYPARRVSAGISAGSAEWFFILSTSPKAVLGFPSLCCGLFVCLVSGGYFGTNHHESALAADEPDVCFACVPVLPQESPSTLRLGTLFAIDLLTFFLSLPPLTLFPGPTSILSLYK